MALTDWVNNFNDEQPTATIQAKLSAQAVAGAVDANWKEFVKLDSDGGANWAIGDEFQLESDSTETVHSLTALAIDVNTTEAVVGFTPALEETVNAGKLVYKEGGSYGVGYAGNQRSMENHLRLRNQGQI